MLETLKQKSAGVIPAVLIDGPAINEALKTVLCKETDALVLCIQHFPENACTIVDDIINTTGKIIISGMGKSGLIGKKIVATFSSLGLPAIFLHPAEALHGDLGVVCRNDYFIALSKSGTGQELETILSVVRSRGVKTSLICCNQGALASYVDTTVVLSCGKEACDLNLAPTSSSTVTIVFGDALAVVASRLKGLTSQEYALNHPAGALGKRLLWTVRSFMISGEQLPLLRPTATFTELLLAMTRKKFGAGIIVDDYGCLLGLVTDGDLRRACNLGPEVFSKTAGLIMTPKPKTIAPHELGYRAIDVMEKFNITSLVVTENDGTVVGLVHIHDLIKAGLRA